MTIKSLILTAMVGLGTLTLAGCVDGGGPYGGGYSGVYVSSFDSPYYGDGYYRGYRRDYYRGDYRRDRRYSRSDYRGRDNDRPHGPGRDYHPDGGGNGRIIVPNPDTPRGPMFSRGGN
jgi:hypothetical protein